jgi:hypothetical protein
MNKFELPKNSDFEKILKKNLEYTNPLEMKQKEVSGKKTIFPFWKPVDSEGAEVFYDYDAYLSKKEQKLRSAPKDNTGAVKPKSTFKTNANGSIDVKDTYEDNSIIGKMNGLITKMNNTNLSDKTGVVKPQAEDMSKGTVKPQTTQDGIETTVKTDSNAAKPKGDNVGVVKPKSEGMPKNTTKPITTQDGIPTTVKEESFAAKPKGDNVGTVKPKTEDKKVKKVKPTTTSDTTEPVIVEKSNAAKPKGDNVGVVKPQASFDVNANMVDFTRYMK